MPEATVAAILSRSGASSEEILLTRRGTRRFTGQWCLPGGHIDPYETAEEAVVREVKEETGLAFQPHFFRYFDEIIPDRNIHAVVIVFTGRATGGTLAAAPCEVTEIRWFALAEARALPLAFRHNDILDVYAHQPQT